MDRYFSNMSPADSALLKEWVQPRGTPNADREWLTAHPTVVSKESIDALNLCADFLRTRRMVAQSFFFRWKAHILKLCMETSIDSFFGSLTRDGEVERVMRQIGGPEAQHMAEIIAGVGVEKSGSLSAQIDDDGVTHDVKQREAAEHATTRTPVEQWLKLRDEWQTKWRADFQSQVMALASDEALVRTQIAALLADPTRKAAMEAKAHAAYADVEKCEQAKAAVRHRLAPTVIGLFDLLMPEFTENGVLEWRDLVKLAAEGKDIRDDDVTYLRIRASPRPAVQSLNELTAEIAKHCFHVPAVLQLLSPSDGDLFIPILRHFRIQAIALFAAAYLSLIGVEIGTAAKP